MSKQDPNIVCQLVNNALQQAKEADLEIEVIAWALMELKENPDTSIEQALIIGLEEWVK